LDVEFTFRRVVEEYERTEASSEEEDAVKAGVDMEQASVDFYEDWVDEAEDDRERDFAEQVVDEKRARLSVLQDLQYYYEDPEGWALSMGKGGLEGV
jgi:rubrerythrin